MFLKKQIIGAMSMMVAVVHSVTMSACTPHSVREAESVVIQADSLWHEGKMYGVDMGDSATLAQAYETLKEHSAFSRQCAAVCPFVRSTSSLCTSFAHACYHYGKLLRAKDDPVSAMQAFIDATHSPTDDYHILGRVYSNMGSICHIAGDFSLAYDMYECSANMFLQNGDTLNYYYGLNDMAFELAEQGKKEEAFVLLSHIEDNCSERNVLIKTMETKANAYLYAHQYDSAICYTYPLLSCNYVENTWVLILAQAYSFMGNNDSAVYYANLVLSLSDDLYDTNNALYILTNHDKTKGTEDILEIAGNRADVQKLIENKRSKYAQASQLITLDRDRENNLAWLYSMIATLLLIGLVMWIYVLRKRKQRNLLSQQVNELTIMNTIAMREHEQIVHEHTEYANNLVARVKQNCIVLAKAEDFPRNIYWKDFAAMCKLINDNFGMLVGKLQKNHQLSEKEIRLCVLVLIGNPSSKQLADMLCYSESGIRNYKNRIAKKLGTNSIELRDFLINLSIN